jgi:hypothetical protein
MKTIQPSGFRNSNQYWLQKCFIFSIFEATFNGLFLYSGTFYQQHPIHIYDFIVFEEQCDIPCQKHRR